MFRKDFALYRNSLKSFKIRGKYYGLWLCWGPVKSSNMAPKIDGFLLKIHVTAKEHANATCTEILFPDQIPRKAHRSWKQNTASNSSENAKRDKKSKIKANVRKIRKF